MLQEHGKGMAWIYLMPALWCILAYVVIACVKWKRTTTNIYSHFWSWSISHISHTASSHFGRADLCRSGSVFIYSTFMLLSLLHIYLWIDQTWWPVHHCTLDTLKIVIHWYSLTLTCLEFGIRVYVQYVFYWKHNMKPKWKRYYGYCRHL